MPASLEYQSNPNALVPLRLDIHQLRRVPVNHTLAVTTQKRDSVDCLAGCRSVLPDRRRPPAPSAKARRLLDGGKYRAAHARRTVRIRGARLRRNGSQVCGTSGAASLLERYERAPVASRGEVLRVSSMTTLATCRTRSPCLRPARRDVSALVETGTSPTRSRSRRYDHQGPRTIVPR